MLSFEGQQHKRLAGRGQQFVISGRLVQRRAIIAWIVAAATLGNAYSKDAETTVLLVEDRCELYLAPSTIPNAGLGIFTTKPLKEGDVVGNGDIGIPIVDLEWHRGDKKDDFNIFLEYAWQGRAVGMSFESADESPRAVNGFLPGMDAAINCNAALINAAQGVSRYDTSLHRGRDPSAGSITPFHNGSTHIIADVPAGGELFKYYGDNWFESRYRLFGNIALQPDYKNADELLTKLSSFDFLSDKAQQQLWSIAARIPVLWESRLSNAFPKSYTAVVKAMKQGLRSLSQPSAIRTVESLERAGRCIDGIRPEESTIQVAGRGAFATRFFAKGSIITGSPLLHIPFSEEYVNMYEYYVDNNGYTHRDSSYVSSQQLLVNYCYGHTESTLLLCPYGAGVNYINHNASRANVRIQWTPDGINNQNDERFDWSVDLMEDNYRIGLSFDYVATRDIEAGEELFLDYGPEWEEAWLEHLLGWKPGSQDYLPALVWNEQFKNEPLRTKKEQELDPYPHNVRMRCHSWLGRDGGTWPDNYDVGLDCTVLDRTTNTEGEEVYQVELFYKEGKRRIGPVPRGAIKFVDVPYTTDMFLPNAFRHKIMIPDDVFPEKWKNRS